MVVSKELEYRYNNQAIHEYIASHLALGSYSEELLFFLCYFHCYLSQVKLFCVAS
jgi:hypothetical protein